MTGVEVAKLLNTSPQYYYDIERGKKNLSADKLIQLAKIFDVQLEELLGDWDEQIHPEFDGDLSRQLAFDAAVYKDAMSEPKQNQSYFDLNEKDERDIAKMLEEMMDGLSSSNQAFSFMGEPMDDEDRELLRISLENTLRMSKQMAKKKFTPKKYRNEE